MIRWTIEFTLAVSVVVLLAVWATATVGQVKTLAIPETELAGLYDLMHDGLGVTFDAEFFLLANEYGALNIVSTINGYGG